MSVFKILAVFIFWLFSADVFGALATYSEGGGQPVLSTRYFFFDTQVSIDFLKKEPHSEMEVFVTRSGAKPVRIFSGKVKEIGINAHSSPSFARQIYSDFQTMVDGVKTTEPSSKKPHKKVVTKETAGVQLSVHRSKDFTYIVTDSDELLLITNKGEILSHADFPSEFDQIKLQPINILGKESFIFAVDSLKLTGTFLFEKDENRLISISNKVLRDNELSQIFLDSEEMILYVPAGRSLDLKHLEMEAQFQPKDSKKIIGQSGGRFDAMEYLLDLLPDFRDSIKNSRKISLADEDTKLVGKMLEAFKKSDSKAVVLLGQSGTGKTTLIQGLVEQLPSTWEILEVPREVFQQGGSLVGEIDKRVNALVQASLSQPVVLIFDELHSLKGLGTHQHSSVDIFQMLKKHIALGNLMIIATDTAEEYQRAFGSDPGLRRRFTELRVEEPRQQVLLKKLRAWAEKRITLDISEDVLKRIVSVSSDYDLGSFEPARSIRLMEQIESDLRNESLKQVRPQDVDRAAWNLYGIGPQNPKKFFKKNETAREDLGRLVIDQSNLVDAMLDLWREVNLGVSSKKHRSLLIVGPTGAGKTFSGQNFADQVLQDPERFLEIDATKYRNGNFDSLIGTAKYHSEAPQGILPEFLRGRGKGRNVILINEVEKAHPDLIKILMEMLDTGRLQGGDGQTYYLGRSLVIFTSNRGSDEIFPPTQGEALSQRELQKRLLSFNDQRVRELFLKASSENLYDTSNVWGSAELQRIDRALAVLPPSFEGAVSIVTKHAKDISARMNEKYFYTLEIDEMIVEEIVRQFYRPAEGVRFVLQKTGDLLNRIHQEAVLNLNPRSGSAMKAFWHHRDEAGNSFIRLRLQKSKKEILIAGLLARVEDRSPLMDSQSLSKLQGIEEEIKVFVFGQDEAVRIVSRAVRTRALNAKLNVPGHALLLGSTGTGKTEMGRALAQVLYGSKNRIKQFGLGQIKNEHDWANIFGSPRGVIGSDKMPPFEQALHEFPEGMVIILDEIGNMGADPTMPSSATPRSELLKRLYDIFEEGVWTSPLGKTYDLRKHFILMTSNEGQEFFENLPNDDLRQAEWERINERDFLQGLLREHGWPEPLLGRIGNNIALMKPLLREEQMKVAQKELERVFDQLKSSYDFQNLRVAEGFYDRLSESFFSHSRGGRSLREVAENAVVDLVGQVLIENSFQREKLADAEMILDISDSFSGRFRKRSKDSSKREVVLSIKIIFKDHSEANYEIDLTREAKPKVLADFRSSLITAYHEAGHAVVNQPDLTGERVGFITIRGEGYYGGYVRYETDGHLSTIDRPSVIARIARTLAGQIAQELAGFPKDSGWTSDLRQARSIAEKAIAQWGLSEEALKFPVQDGAVLTQNPAVQKEISLLVEEGRLAAERLLKERWVLARMVATALVQHGHLEVDEFLKLQEQSQEKEIQVQQKLIGQSAIPKRWRCAGFLQILASQ
ncbi:MAG: AAA family ATPase [Bdellovibrionota bacterium]